MENINPVSQEVKMPFLPSPNNFYEYHRRQAPRAAILNITEDFNTLLRDIRFTIDHHLQENESGSTCYYTL